MTNFNPKFLILFRVWVLLFFLGAFNSDSVLGETLSEHSVSRKTETRVIGRLTFPKGITFKEIDLKTSQLILIEEFEPRPLPTPNEFDKWDQKKRNQWYSKWTKTEQGKKFQADEEKRFSKLHKYEAKLKKGAEFKFSNVAKGGYDLAGELTLEHEGKFYFADFFAKVKVSEVEEINLDSIEIQFHRVLRVGETVPGFKIKSTRGENINAKTIKGKPTLIFFWAENNPLSKTLIDSLRKLETRKKISVLSIQIGDTSQDQTDESFANIECVVEKLNSPIGKAFGIGGVPALFLVDPSGKLSAVHQDFAKDEFELSTVINRCLRQGNF